MKEMSVKKIVLCAIAALGALALFIGLAFSIAAISIAGVSVKKAGMSASGFNMLSFEFPTLIRASLMQSIP